MAMDLDAVLSQVRRDHTPTISDRERVGAALATALAVGGAAGAAQVATTAGIKGAAGLKGASGVAGSAGLTSAAGLEGAVAVKGAAALKVAVLGLPFWVKGAVGVSVLVGAVGGGLYGVDRPRSSERVDPSSATPVAKVEAPLTRSAPRDEPAVVEPKVTLEARAVAVGSTTQPSGSRPESKAANSRVAASSATPIEEGPSLTSIGELRLIGRASKALREGRTEEARSALNEHQRRYSNTALVQERAGLELLARCAEAPDLRTQQAAQEFLKSSPNSPLAGSIRRECLD
jgi:hypothetical protein